MKPLLPTTTTHVVMRQERKLARDEDMRKAQAWYLRDGWKSHFEPGTSGPKGGVSACVAVLARASSGLHIA
eukprot:3857098-Pyramimonas_sp.AAC.1